jgi:transposase
MGDAAEIRSRAVRRQRTDTRDAEHRLDLLLKFPRVRVPTPEERDRRQLLKHRDKLVRRQTSVRNQLHFLAISQGLCRKQKLWSTKGRAELEALSLGPWARQRRQELLDRLGLRVEELNQAAGKRSSVGTARS